jgi:hypothetical protein
LLDLLVVGAKVQRIAGRLGISLRTPHRRVYRLLGMLDTVARFRAGMLATCCGWV